ncbi:MAG TPA: type IV toxin-antitoxin system AbiEi family antitoxin domain-containing protein, partial [Acidimicrobiales bacterium]|nr:type IV toxin-antitoxin system AbiEi family antitoxin domain-containing protein [Acidimicrobiales bacterium]
MPTAEGRLIRLAADRHGVFTLNEALAVGVTPAALRHRIAAGAVLRVHEGVFRFAVVPDTWRAGLVAAVLSGGATTLASHRSAARLWELRGVPRWKAEVTALGRRLPLIEGVLVHRTDRLDPLDLGAMDGIPCTSASRTLLDLGAV